ncbi:MAG TPA: hypothetical protein VF894_09095 [Anaeromyxobacter sp.]
MTLVHAMSILSVALGQAAPAPGGTEGSPKLGAQVQLPEPRLVPVPAKTPPPALVPDGAPVLRLDRTSRCFERTIGGRWRAQCDATTKTCLVAPDAELTAEGEQHGDLDRASACVLPGWREDDLVPQGYKLVPALGEAPPGWRRDEQGRVMQVSFDLARRIWLGAGYGAGTFPWSKQGEGTAGIRWDVPFHLAGAPALARIRALETFVGFDGEFADFTVFGLDASRAYPSPLLRFTTFVGKPRRFDPPLFIGGWLEVVRIESLRTESRRWFDRISAGSAALTLDLWRSRDLASFVRLRGGAGYETVDQLSGGAWTPQAAADLDLTIDEGGFHHLRGTFLAEWIKPAGSEDFQPEDPAVARLPSDRHRWTGKAEYEWIFLAVNDQPLSLVVDARAQSRNDVPELPTKWLYQGTASVRFNLWAPPRRDARQQDTL